MFNGAAWFGGIVLPDASCTVMFRIRGRYVSGFKR
jgi:hypothetical protein